MSPFGLTEQQEAAAALVARGMTNRQVGEALGISEPAAASSVAAAAQKTGAFFMPGCRRVLLALVHLDGLDADGRQRFLDGVLRPGP